jgi:hypothetical protein
VQLASILEIAAVAVFGMTGALGAAFVQLARRSLALGVFPAPGALVGREPRGDGRRRSPPSPAPGSRSGWLSCSRRPPVERSPMGSALGEESARGSGDVPPEVNVETTNFQRDSRGFSIPVARFVPFCPAVMQR